LRFDEVLTLIKRENIASPTKVIKVPAENKYSIFWVLAAFLWIIPLVYFTVSIEGKYFGEAKKWTNFSEIQIGDFIDIKMDAWSYYQIEEVTTNNGRETSKKDGNIYFLATQPGENDAFLLRIDPKNTQWKSILDIFYLNKEKGQNEELDPLVADISGQIKPLSSVEKLDEGQQIEDFFNNEISFYREQYVLNDFHFLLDANVELHPQSEYSSILRNAILLSVLWGISLLAAIYFGLMRKKEAYEKLKILGKS
jgi:hypothetical protein